MEKKYYRKHKEIYKAFIIETLEGDGTSDFPYESVKYVYDENMHLIGIIETELAKKLLN